LASAVGLAVAVPLNDTVAPAVLADGARVPVMLNVCPDEFAGADAEVNDAVDPQPKNTN
jgi:hypothetical protein